jgi:hypothetical protein
MVKLASPTKANPDHQSDNTIDRKKALAGAVNAQETVMSERRGPLPGRYVPPHIRKWPHRPWDYVNVAAYQEHVNPMPAKTIAAPPQLEFDLAEVERGGQPDHLT